MAQKQIAWNSGSGYIKLTYTGQGNGSITVDSDPNDIGVARSQVVTVQTVGGAVMKNLTVRQGACPFPVGHVQDFDFTGAVQSVTLPAGKYKLQCWGAQGGSNAADSTYGITAQAGGKGGYSEGVLTLTQPTTLYAFVGGQGGASGNGGWNCGGGSSGSTEYASGNDSYITKMACGGGATDFALVTSSMSYSSRRNNRSDASLLSRIIVAGGGSGGAMGCKRQQTTVTEWQTIGTIDCNVPDGSTGVFDGKNYAVDTFISSSLYYTRLNFDPNVNPFNNGDKIRIIINNAFAANDLRSRLYWIKSGDNVNITSTTRDLSYELTWNYAAPPSSDQYFRLQLWEENAYFAGSVTIQKQVSVPTHTDTLTSQVGYAGGGVNGDGCVTSSHDYRGRQDAAGYGSGTPSFGKGGNNGASTVAYGAGAGGAGWYGGGSNNLNNSYIVNRSGGGSGFVNIAANAQYRPSGYTGIELDSGTTTVGSSSFPSISGGTETGHAGNGYARITRLQ